VLAQIIQEHPDADYYLLSALAEGSVQVVARGGKMFVLCDNRSCMRNIRSEINYSLGNQSLVASLTNLADLQVDRRGEGDRIWLGAQSWVILIVRK
jgi:hypothetical protein